MAGSVVRQRAARYGGRHVLLAIAGERGTGREEQGLEILVEDEIPELSPLGNLVEVGEREVRSPEVLARRVGVAHGGPVVRRVEHQDPLEDALAVEEPRDGGVVRGAPRRETRQV